MSKSKNAACSLLLLLLLMLLHAMWLHRLYSGLHHALRLKLLRHASERLGGRGHHALSLSLLPSLSLAMHLLLDLRVWSKSAAELAIALAIRLAVVFAEALAVVPAALLVVSLASTFFATFDLLPLLLVVDAHEVDTPWEVFRVFVCRMPIVRRPSCMEFSLHFSWIALVEKTMNLYSVGARSTMPRVPPFTM